MAAMSVQYWFKLLFSFVFGNVRENPKHFHRLLGTPRTEQLPRRLPSEPCFVTCDEPDMLPHDTPAIRRAANGNILTAIPDIYWYSASAATKTATIHRKKMTSGMGDMKHQQRKACAVSVLGHLPVFRNINRSKYSHKVIHTHTFKVNN